jgi:hypothetical protein
MVGALGRRHWIPPVALVAGQLAHGASWILLLVLALHRPFTLGAPALGWLHLIALGWLTMTALAILVHVIPGFTDATWTGEGIARGAIFIFEAAVLVLVVAFWNGATAVLPWAGTLIVLALGAYLVPASRTLATGFAGPETEAAIARALLITLGSLFITALIGAALAWALAAGGPAPLLSSGPPIHASFGIIGWLTVLVMGVSTRTVRPITGARSRRPWAHIVAGGCEIGGVLLFAIGLTLRTPVVEWIGVVAVVLGALVYVADLLDILLRATVVHRPPQAFLGVAAAWLVAGLGLSVGAAAGSPSGAAAVYVLLVGWLGQMVNGHLYHIGIRLIATIALGDGDETRPGELLTAPLSWASFALFQMAVAGGACALVFTWPSLLAGAASAGICAWIATCANAAIALRRALNFREPPDSPLTVSLLRGIP